ncbi:SAM-dependent methyltransferase [Candidatus Poriferisodalis sp.]|uniref:SAM-dependent methyltransferase n=1 Tax=Candidatus Poriferisodalis sp. TaxID=3101277 RepID=UPI003B024E36
MSGPVGGTVRFDAFMEDALYGPSGFYVRGGRPAARDGDFATSVELGTLFARCVAGYLDRTWNELGRPDPFVVVEGGAGRGTLCRQVLTYAGDCRRALRYVMVERVAHQRADALTAVADMHSRPPASPVTGLRANTGDEDAGDGPVTSSEQPVIAAADLPKGPVVGVVLANELLDNLPFRLLERSATGWREVHIKRDEPAAEASQTSECDGTSESEELLSAAGTAAVAAPAALAGAVADAPDPAGVAGPAAAVAAVAAPAAATGTVSELLFDAPDDAAAMADALAPHAEPGARVPLQLKAVVWVGRALRLVDRGRLLVFDYGVPTTAELAARSVTEWLRTYRAHRRGHDPLGDPGSADITCDVAFDQLPPGATLTLQADWLTGAGIADMTVAAQRLWQRSRANPTADSLAARTLLDEAAALTDPHGMGAFWAAEWHVG